MQCSLIRFFFDKLFRQRNEAATQHKRRGRAAATAQGS
jgi:hypothetical protein